VLQQPGDVLGGELVDQDRRAQVIATAEDLNVMG